MEYIHESSDLVRALQEYNAFFQKHQDLYAQAQLLAQVGVLYSYSSHAFQKWEKSNTNTWKSLSQMLMDLHVPFCILLAEKHLKDASMLRDLEVLFITEPPALSPESETVLTDFVRHGGSLVVLEGIGTDEGAIEEQFQRFLRSLSGEEISGGRKIEARVGEGRVFCLPDIPIQGYLKERQKWIDPINPLHGPPESLRDFLNRCRHKPLLKVEAHPLTAVNLS